MFSSSWEAAPDAPGAAHGRRLDGDPERNSNSHFWSRLLVVTAATLLSINSGRSSHSELRERLRSSSDTRSIVCAMPPQ